ncbi:MAG: hypothetical protein WD512_13355, partial [Candidatus Paceibacterota bacterium]
NEITKRLYQLSKAKNYELPKPEEIDPQSSTPLSKSEGIKMLQEGNNQVKMFFDKTLNAQKYTE